MSDNQINTNTNLEAKWTIGEKPTTSGVSQSNTHATSLGRKIWNSIKTFPLISLFRKHKPRQVVTLQTSPQTTTRIAEQRSNYKLHECCQNFNLNSQISSQNIQKLCEHIDRFQNLNSLDIDTQKNIFLCILKNYNRLYSTPEINTQALITNIEKIFNDLDLNNINIKLSDKDLKVLNLASFDNNEKTNLNDLLNLLRKLHNFTGKTKILNKILLETLKQSIINNLNAIKREANDSQILLLKIQIRNYIEQEQSIPTDFLKELLKHLSDPSETELNTFVNTIIEQHKNEQTGSTANDLPANQKENPTPPIPRQISEKNHEDVPQTQHKKISIRQQPKTPFTQPRKTEEVTPPQNPEQGIVSQNINFFQSLIDETNSKTQHLQQIQKK